MTISVIIPCFNEEKNVVKSVMGLIGQTRKVDQIIVVNDGSTDKTLAELKKVSKHVEIVNLAKNSGNKSRAQQEGLKLVTSDIFITTDADSLLDKHFVERVAEDFKDKKVIAVAGYVKSLKHNFLTSCREIEYVVSQRIHKEAQSRLDAMYVIPGCAGAFRTDIFKKHIHFDHDTLTEDLDFTFKLHKLGFKIKYDKKAICYTQDPGSINSYINQMRRWYAGGWQNIKKHTHILNRPFNTLELAMTYIEGLVFSFILFLVPLISIQYYIGMIISYMFFILIIALFAAIVDKRWDILLYSPLYLVVMYLNAFVFLEQFIKEVVYSKNNLLWFHPQRRFEAI